MYVLQIWSRYPLNPFCRTISSVRQCRELEEPKGPKSKGLETFVGHRKCRATQQATKRFLVGFWPVSLSLICGKVGYQYFCWFQGQFVFSVVLKDSGILHERRTNGCNSVKCWPFLSCSGALECLQDTFSNFAGLMRNSLRNSLKTTKDSVKTHQGLLRTTHGSIIMTQDLFWTIQASVRTMSDGVSMTQVPVRATPDPVKNLRICSEKTQDLVQKTEGSF